MKSEVIKNSTMLASLLILLLAPLASSDVPVLSCGQEIKNYPYSIPRGNYLGFSTSYDEPTAEKLCIDDAARKIMEKTEDQILFCNSVKCKSDEKCGSVIGDIKVKESVVTSMDCNYILDLDLNEFVWDCNCRIQTAEVKADIRCTYCNTPAYCGDGGVQKKYGEECEPPNMEDKRCGIYTAEPPQIGICGSDCKCKTAEEPGQKSPLNKDSQIYNFLSYSLKFPIEFLKFIF